MTGHEQYSHAVELGFQVPDLPLSAGLTKANDLTFLRSYSVCEMKVLGSIVSKFPSNILPASLPHKRCPTLSFFFSPLLHDFVSLRVIKERLEVG